MKLALLLLWSVWLGAQEPSRDIQVSGRAPGVPRAGKLALCIGNNSYVSVAPLKNPGNDAADMCAALKKFGFQVEVKLNLDHAKIDQAVQQFAQSIAGDETKVAILFYAGHGVQVGGVNYLVPTDIDLRNQTRADMKYKALAADEVLDKIKQGPTGVRVLILDACRNDPFGNRAMGLGLAPMEATLGTMVVFSTGAGRTASDNPGSRNGLFTQHLLAAMGQKAPFIDVMRQVREQVFEASGRAQRPFLEEDIIGDFYLAGKEQDSAPPAGPRTSTPVSAAPQRGESALDKGMRFFRAKQFEPAAEAFQVARKIEPENAFAHNAAGVALSALGRNAQAVECFNMAIGLKPTYAAAYVNRGLAYLKVPRYELAAEDFSWAISEDPENPLAYRWRGKALLGLRKNDEAAQDLDRALELDRGSPEAWRLRGVARYRLKKYPESLADLNQALQLAPDDAQNYTARAATYRALGQHDKAAADDRRAEQQSR